MRAIGKLRDGSFLHGAALLGALFMAAAVSPLRGVTSQPRYRTAPNVERQKYGLGSAPERKQGYRECTRRMKQAFGPKLTAIRYLEYVGPDESRKGGWAGGPNLDVPGAVRVLKRSGGDWQNLPAKDFALVRP